MKYDSRTRKIGDRKVILGYIKVKTETGWVFEHRHVMQQLIGSTLEPHERVHHKNGDRADNSPENLELWKVKKKDPAGVRAADYHCPGCRCFEHAAVNHKNGDLADNSPENPELILFKSPG